jgi:hypothetical protein
LAPAARAARWSPGHAEEISECEEAGFDGHVIGNKHTLRDYYSVCDAEDGQTKLLRFRSPALPETVDGVIQR